YGYYFLTITRIVKMDTRKITAYGNRIGTHCSVIVGDVIRNSSFPDPVIVPTHIVVVTTTDGGDGDGGCVGSSEIVGFPGGDKVVCGTFRPTIGDGPAIS